MRNEHFGHLATSKFKNIRSKIYVHIMEDDVSYMCYLEDIETGDNISWNGGDTLDEARRSFKDKYFGTNCEVIPIVHEFEYENEDEF